MSAFRLFAPTQVFFDLVGRLAAGGYIKFFAAGTDTAADVYGDEELTINNGSQVAIGTDGRPVVDIWGNASYRVRLYKSDDTIIAEADDVEIAGGTATAIPALVPGQFITTDGSVLQFAPIIQVPDPTGQSGKWLNNDGANPLWKSLDLPDPADIDVTDTTLRIGDTATPTVSYLRQRGTGTMPASGGHTASGSVTFPTAFTDIPYVSFQATGGGVTPDGFFPILSRTAVSATGFSLAANVNEGGTASGANITSVVNFDWIAEGSIATPTATT